MLDDLSTGYRSYVPDDVPLVDGSVADPAAVAQALDEHDIAGVVHLAGLKYAGVSVDAAAGVLPRERDRHPGAAGGGGRARHRQLPVLGQLVLVRHPGRRAWWTRTPSRGPESPYGQSKVIGEWLLRDMAAVTPGLRQSSLRYFNVVRVGAAGAGRPQPAQPVPEGVPRALARRGAAGVRHRLRHPRRHLRARLRARGRPGRRARGGRQAPGGGQAGGAAPTTSAAARARRCWRWSSTILRVTGYDVEPELRPRRPGRSGADRGRGGPDRRRPGLARPARPGRHDLQRLDRLAAPARGARRRARRRRAAGIARA